MHNRLLVYVEGHTEEDFVNKVLCHELYKVGFISVQARLIGNSRLRARRGGIVSWKSARKGIIEVLKKDRGLILSTMVDYYGLPQSHGAAWPGRANANLLPHAHKADSIEKLLLEDIRERMGPKFDTSRFVPFVMMHEFEALLFSDCYLFASAIDRPELEPEFQNALGVHSNPERINDSPNTAPSKRIERLVPNYNKRLMEMAASQEIGISAMRAACPHFATWWGRLVEQR